MVPLPYKKAPLPRSFPLREGAGGREPLGKIPPPSSLCDDTSPTGGGRLCTFSPARGVSLLPYSLLLLPCPPPPRVQQKFNSPKISSHESTLSRQPPRTKTPPLTPPSQPRAAPGLFRAKPGPFWVRFGLFWVRTRLFRVDSGLSRAKIAPIWAPFPPPGSPFRPGRCAKTSPLILRTQSRPVYLNFPKSHKL